MAYKKTVYISKDILIELYVVKRWSAADVGRYLQCSSDTVLRRLKMYNIERRSVKQSIPSEELVGLYKMEQWSVYRLAQHFKCSHTTIASRLQELGVLRKRKRQTPNKGQSLDAKTLQRAYESGNSATFLADATGLSRWKILQLLRGHGVEIRHNGNKKNLHLKEMSYLYTEHNMSTVDIGIAYGVKGSTVANHLREAGLCLRGNALVLDIDYIESLYKQGTSILQIAKQLGCSSTAIRNRLTLRLS